MQGLAARQLADYRARTPGTFFSEEDRPRLSLEDAYAVQGGVAALRGADGETVAGYKVGCTGPNVREQFGMDGPHWRSSGSCRGASGSWARKG